MLALLRAKARLILPHWPWIAFVASALMLGAAHYAQKVDGLPPCILCLKQREAYWAALGISGAAILIRFTPWRARLERWLMAALALAFLYGLGMAIYHVGAEQKWWPGPMSCARSDPTSPQSVADLLAGKPLVVVSCEDPTYWPIRSFITMAGWNALISAKLAIWSLAAAFARKSA